MTTIEWTDRTWNPVRGCSRISEGCRNCYAERQAARFTKWDQPFYGFSLAGRWSGKVELIAEKLEEPLRWRKPSRVFVNSMSDLFHEALPNEAIDRVFAVMGSTRHTFQVLTKRPQRMLEYLRHERRDERIWDAMPGVDAWERRDRQDKLRRLPMPNVWLGVSVEGQKTADHRIPPLLQTPAAVRFISAEPLLGPVDLTPMRIRCERCKGTQSIDVPGGGAACPDCLTPYQGQRPGLEWVIVGGESGPNARQCDVDWIRSIVRECKASQVPVFVKQLGSRPVGSVEDVRMGKRLVLGPIGDGRAVGAHLKYRDRKGGDPAEWPEDLRVREFPL